MNIAVIWPLGPGETGSWRRLQTTLTVWREMGHTADLIELGAAENRGSRAAVHNLLLDVFGMRDVRHSLSRARPDVIYLRHSYAFPGLTRALAAFEVPIVAEIHSSEITERSGASSWRARVSSVFRRSLFTQLAGAVFVTRELVDHPDFRDVSGPRAVVTNGALVPPFGEPPANDRPVIGMSAANDLPWQGFDRLGRLARAHPDCLFELCVPSTDLESVVREVVPTNVDIRVGLTGEDYSTALAGWDVALGTLALERDGRSWACPLKTRDYCATGIPCVLPYLDDDLAEVDDPLVWTCPGEDWSTDASHERFRAFVDRSRGRRLDASIRRRVDAREKELERVGFLASVVTESARRLEVA